MGYLEIKKGIVKDGKLVSSCKYDDLKHITIDGKEIYNVFEFIEDGILGLLHINEDETGRDRKITGLHEIYHVSKEYVIVSIHDERHGEKYGILRLPYLNEIAPFIFDDVEVLDDNLIKVKKDGLYGIVNNNGVHLLATYFKKIEYDKNTNTIKSEL